MKAGGCVCLNLKCWDVFGVVCVLTSGGLGGCKGGMAEYRQNYMAIVVCFSCGVCLWGRWEVMLVSGRIEARGCFTKMCVCVCSCGSRG